MKQFFRFALWMLFVIAHLQGKPVISENCFPFNMADLGFDYLLEDVSCEQNVMFNSPAVVQENCYAEALTRFKEGLQNASLRCEDKKERINATLEALEEDQAKLDLPLAANSSECKWERKEFAYFVNDFQRFVQEFNSENLGIC